MFNLTLKAPATGTRALLVAAMTLSAGMSFAAPQPTAATDGVVFDNPAAGVTNITAPDSAIIDYAGFNIGVGETVNFIQPSAAARVLNRIHSATPTQINGTLTANGIVYLVNPSGVMFGPGSVVDAAGIYAAGGSLSNSDFINGTDRFTGLSGSVQSHGMVRADSIAALIGREVVNTGTISVPNGTAILAAGSEVLIGSPRGGVMVQLDVTPNKGENIVSQDGTVEAKQVALSSSDLFALAVSFDLTKNSMADGSGFTLPEADTDGDGDIDIDDIMTNINNFTGPLPPGTGTATQQMGDVDGDGDVDGADLDHLYSLYTGPITPPPPPPPTDPSISDDANISRLPPVETQVNLTEADLGILQQQLGIVPRSPSAQERIEEAQGRGLYNDLSPVLDNSTNPDGSMDVVVARLDADVVRAALAFYRAQLEVEGLSPAERSAQIKGEVTEALKGYTPGSGFDADGFVAHLRQKHDGVFKNLVALEALRRLSHTMGLSEREKENTNRVMINRVRPESLTYEQMKKTLEMAVDQSLIVARADAG